MHILLFVFCGIMYQGRELSASTLGIFRMNNRYFAFYWTLPVPWVGFTKLSANIEKAVTESRTIAFQRAVVQRHIHRVGGIIIPQNEVAILETWPDRGSFEIGQEFHRLLEKAEKSDALVAIVNLAGQDGWRSHQFIAEHFGHRCCDQIDAPVEDELGASFNPYQHFREWRQATREKINTKHSHRQSVFSALEGISASTLADRAASLNALELLTHNGKNWTADNLRKFIGKLRIPVCR